MKKHTAERVAREMYNELMMSDIEISNNIEESFALCVSNGVSHIQWVDMIRTIEQDTGVQEDEKLKAKIKWWIRLYKNQKVSQRQYIWRSVVLVLFCSIMPLIMAYLMTKTISQAVKYKGLVGYTCENYILLTIFIGIVGIVVSVITWINSADVYRWAKRVKPDNHHKKEVV